MYVNGAENHDPEGVSHVWPMYLLSNVFCCFASEEVLASNNLVKLVCSCLDPASFLLKVQECIFTVFHLVRSKHQLTVPACMLVPKSGTTLIVTWFQFPDQPPRFHLAEAVADLLMQSQALYGLLQMDLFFSAR